MRYDLDLEEHRFSKLLILKILITLVEAAIVVFGAFAITHYGLETMTVSGEYMSPTLKTGDSILINKLSYRLHKIRRNDVVVVEQNGSEHSYLTLERVIGLPGETVLIQDGQVYINGKVLKEKLDFPLMENGGMALESVTLEKNQYFVLGDNRNECEDSRNATVGNIAKSEIVGKAWIRLNSFTFVGMIDQFRSVTGTDVTSE
jgi:signal peptidase I